MISSPAVPPVRRHRIGLLVLPLLLAFSAGVAHAEREYGKDPKVGIEEHLGETLPLDLVFSDEDGDPITLKDIVKDRPIVLTIVYFGCPNICGPLMHELADTVDRVDLEPGKDYDLLTVSFDTREDWKLAATAKDNLLSGMKREVPDEAWRFLTGNEESILALTEAVGFYFQMEEESQTFVHAGVVVFVTKEGKIVRYLGGVNMLPFDLKLAVIDAMEGRTRTTMQRVQSLCYGYDPEGKTYVLLVNRIVLVVSLVILGVFLAVLLIKRRKAPVPAPAKAGAAEGDAPPPAPEERSNG